MNKLIDKHAYFLLMLVVGLAACAGPREATDGPEVEPPPDVDLSEYETFDASEYPVEAPDSIAVSHSVPAALLEGRAGEGRTVTTQGYRIQVFSSIEREEAEVAQQQISHLWSAQQKEMWTEPGSILADAFPNGVPPSYLVYGQPYYKLRVGNFGSRAEAERILEIIQDTYPGAFIVPSTVTVEQ